MHSLSKRWLSHCLVFTLCLSSAAVVFAQSTGGRILGKVSDPSGAALTSVKVTLVNDATAASRDVQTNDSGDYVFVEVVPGTYHVEYELAGFKKSIEKSVSVDVNQVVTLNSTMRIGAKEEGTFRNHMITHTGRIRHSVYYSIIDCEWPAVKARLEEKLARV